MLVAALGFWVSYSAPYSPSSDELVYLTGTLQAKEGNLPDAYMLKGMDFGPYLYPQVMSAWYESFGYWAFKSLYLVTLIIATGLAAYAMYRLLGLQWVPALLLSVVALMPRFSSGQEIFGVLTFKEAIGRAGALPLFFIGTGFLIKRLKEGKSLWPIFGIFGLLLFLHPVTVMLFAFISLVAVAITRAFQRTSLWSIVRETFVSGITFILAGSYLFIEVFQRLGNGVADKGVSTVLYVQAIMFRNAWEFPIEALLWFRHIAIVSAFFIVALIIFYTLPALRSLRERYVLSHGRDLLVWGVATALGSLIITILFPGLNLYFMAHADAPYIFQQWSRISKFYYLGLFVALIPMVYALWQGYLESQGRYKKVLVALLFIAGILSSSFGFEVAQFAIGYKNFEKAYIPQTLSRIPDDTTPAEYREACNALTELGATSTTLMISSDFAFRYYCRAHLYVTNEEGGAYQQLLRSDVVNWYTKLLAQRAALGRGDPQKILDFAKSIGADFVIVPRVAKYAFLEILAGHKIVMTTKHIIVKVAK